MKKTTVRQNKNLVFIAGTLHFLPDVRTGNFGNVLELKARKTANQNAESLRLPTPAKNIWLKRSFSEKHLPEHPFCKLAEIVAHRLENPTNRDFLNKEFRKAKGSNGRKTIVKNDGILRGHAQRTISSEDREEIRGEIALILGESPQGETISFPQWKAIFSNSRKVLRISRKEKRESLLSSLEELQEINFHSDLSADSALHEFQLSERQISDSTEDFCNEIFKSKVRLFIKYIFAAFRGESENRKCKANKKTALEVLRKACNTFRGMGTQSEFGLRKGKIFAVSQGARLQFTRFNEYLNRGKVRMEIEKSAFEKADKEYTEFLEMNAVSA